MVKYFCFIIYFQKVSWLLHHELMKRYDQLRREVVVSSFCSSFQDYAKGLALEVIHPSLQAHSILIFGDIIKRITSAILTIFKFELGLLQNFLSEDFMVLWNLISNDVYVPPLTVVEEQDVTKKMNKLKKFKSILQTLTDYFDRDKLILLQSNRDYTGVLERRNCRSITRVTLFLLLAILLWTWWDDEED